MLNAPMSDTKTVDPLYLSIVASFQIICQAKEESNKVLFQTLFQAYRSFPEGFEFHTPIIFQNISESTLKQYHPYDIDLYFLKLKQLI